MTETNDIYIFDFRCTARPHDGVNARTKPEQTVFKTRKSKKEKIYLILNVCTYVSVISICFWNHALYIKFCIGWTIKMLWLLNKSSKYLSWMNFVCMITRILVFICWNKEHNNHQISSFYSNVSKESKDSSYLVRMACTNSSMCFVFLFIFSKQCL